MPELPEVETIARGVAERIRGERVESVWLSGRKQTLKSPPRTIAKTLEGARIDDVHRVGKHIVFELSRAGEKLETQRAQSAERERGEERELAHPQFIVHLGMTGSLTVVPADKETAKHTHAVLKLSSGRELRFVDPRMFGKLAVVKERFRPAGHEPL